MKHKNKKVIFLSITTLAAIGGLILLNSCKTIPKTAKPVIGFQADKYLGKWYEIARIDFKHEKNLNNTTANYKLNEDGSIQVVNKGFNYKTKEWKEANGKAKFVKTNDVGMLKVSFFGPFYAGYNVIAIDDDYQFALVAGKNLDYLWILSRKKTIPESVKKEYLAMAEEVGYDISKLIWVHHD